MNVGMLTGSHDVARRRKPTVCPRRVFVAEDDANTREVIVTALVDDGYDVIELEDGTEVVECLDIIARDAFRAPDLIAMDVRMPGRSGVDVLEGMRRTGWSTPVVLFTSFASDDLRLRAAAAGSSVVIQKPFLMSELRDAMRRAEQSSCARDS